MGKVVWHGEQFRRELRAGLKQNLSAAAIYLSSQVKADIAQPGTLRYAPVSRRTGKPSKRQITIYNFTHSKPGNPPYKQTGRLRASIAWEVRTAGKLLARVGTNVKYGLDLELGKGRLRPRPYLVPNLNKHRAILVALLTRRIARGALPAVSSNQLRPGILGRGARKAGF